jgi:hypothetical protein
MARIVVISSMDGRLYCAPRERHCWTALLEPPVRIA